MARQACWLATVLDDPRISRRPIPQGWGAFSSIAYVPLTSTDTLRLRNNIPNLFGMLSFKRLPTASTNTNNPGGLRIQRHRAQQFACEFIRHSRNSGLLTLFLIYSVQPPTTSLPYALTIHRDEWHAPLLSPYETERGSTGAPCDVWVDTDDAII